MTTNYVTHKELSQVLIKLSDDSKKDRHEFAKTISGPLMSLENKVNDIHEKMNHIDVLDEKIKNTQATNKELKADIHEIRQDISGIQKKIWIASGVLSVVGGIGSFLATTLSK